MPSGISFFPLAVLSLYGVSVYPSVSLVSAGVAGALPLSGATKEAKRSFTRRSERTKNRRDLFMCLFSVGTKGSDRSIVALSFSDFFISALCFLDAIFRTSLFKTILNPIDRYFTAFTKPLLV